MPFYHGLEDAFVEKLQAEKEKGGLWRDVLADPTLLICVRKNLLHVYWLGMALLTIEPGEGCHVKVTTHEKFLLNPSLRGRIPFDTDRFTIGDLRQRGFTEKYTGPATLRMLKTAAGVYGNFEKIGCHELALENLSVVDREIAFPGNVGQPDLVCFERVGNSVELVFWEAKHFRNRASLRAQAGSIPAAVEQINRYRQAIEEYRENLIDSYKTVVKNLVSLREKM